MNHHLTKRTRNPTYTHKIMYPHAPCGLPNSQVNLIEDTRQLCDLESGLPKHGLRF